MLVANFDRASWLSLRESAKKTITCANRCVTHSTLLDGNLFSRAKRFANAFKSLGLGSKAAAPKHDRRHLQIPSTQGANGFQGALSAKHREGRKNSVKLGNSSVKLLEIGNATGGSGATEASIGGTSKEEVVKNAGASLATTKTAGIYAKEVQDRTKAVEGAQET